MSPRSRPAPEPALDTLLDDADRGALRDAVAEAVLATPPRLRESLDDDPTASLVLVLASRIAAEETSRLLSDAVTSARGAGHSWDVIGRLIGVSRQAAQQRFGGGAAGLVDTATSPDAPARKVLTPLTAFTEMPVLEQEGRRGWHLVDYGTLYHVVEASDEQWEHRRAVWSPATSRRLVAEGWTLVKPATFPWGYYKRRLGRPSA